MKRRKSILLIASAFFIAFTCLCACHMEDKTEEAVPRLNIEKVIIKLLKNGLQADGEMATIQIVANKGFDIKSNAEWLEVDQMQGHGLTIVKIMATENETNAERIGELLVSSGTLQETITVYQSIEEPVVVETPRTLYEESFDWAIPFAKENSDPVGVKQGNSNRTKVSDATIANVWASSGLENWNKERDCINLYRDYLHFNSDNNFDSGIILPTIHISQPVNAILSFVSCPDGRGPDRVPIIVEIVSGAGTLSNDDTKVTISNIMIPEAPWTWSPFQIRLYGIDSSTRIAIRTMGNGESKYCRWFLDNIHIQTTN